MNLWYQVTLRTGVLRQTVSWTWVFCVRFHDIVSFVLDISYWAMAYSIYGPTSCRQKIELGILGLSAIKPRCSVYLAACPAYVGTNISFGRNYWGKYGPFVLFAISVNKSVAFIFLVTYFLQHIYMYSSSTLVNLQAIYSTRSLVIGVYTGKPLMFFLNNRLTGKK